MKKQKFRFLSFLLIAFMFLLAACSGGGSESTSGGDSGESDSGGGEGTVNIGYTGPLSGPAALYGERTLNGVKMAAEEINEEGGIDIDGKKYKVNIVSLDDKYLPNEAGSNAKRLIQENDTPIIFTPHSGGIFALQVFNQVDNFLIGAYSSEPKITEAGNTLTVRIPPRYDGYLAPFTKYQMERFGKKIAFLPTASQYGKDWAEALEPYWEEQGGEIVYNSSIDFTKDTDFFTIITNALKENPDVLFVGGASEPTAKVVKQARELGFEGGFIIMDQAKLDEMKRVTGSYEMLEGSIGVMPLVDSDEAAVPDYVKKYNEKYGEDPGSEAGLNYIGMWAFAKAMEAANSVDDPAKIRDHMQDGLDNIPDYARVYEIPSIGDDGGFESTLIVGAIEDGKVVPIPAE
ncbi:amino acid/amide ABC transporter substrate-binding protein, HAAT family [Mesobacillus persicus]|uniref:Amino acid/amide ABC transporter substrate-binding protein, HAAT family n=1 Tax=Mesobacillus persicus TaxID=930146 RepID=A0A1H8HIH6_9BACI|nr:ABC transporter substrate-binding protein [Mesobacillus persicus]SEN55990.1 amino acid/amide ABC transporter substrate-binding protein, HAAT family [Mesobacillus persicus]